MSSSGRWREPFQAAFQALWAHRMRSVLTTLGIIIGVASVIAVVHLTKSLEARIMADVNREGTSTFFLSPGPSNSTWKKGLKVRRQPMGKQEITELRSLVPEILVVAPEYYLFTSNMLAKVGKISQRVLLHALDENGLDLGNMELACGRNFTSTDRVTRAPVVIMGAKVAEDLDLTEASLGKTFTVAGQTAELIGILKKQGDVPFMPREENEDAIWGTDRELFIPVGSFKELDRWSRGDNPSWRLQLDARMPVKEAEALLRANLRRVCGLHGDDLDSFDLSSNEKQAKVVEKLSSSLMVSGSAMVSISLLVGGIGVMNIMLVSVTERTREIGIRKALGAKRRNILVQFLIEAVVLCVLGGLVGVVLGLGVGTLMSQFLMKHQGSVPLWAFASALVVPALVGLTFGLYPANKAAKLDPIEALRYE
jgi:putative ABC transport system permease protein